MARHIPRPTASPAPVLLPLLQDDTRYVTLRGGLTIALEALTFALDLERRDITLSRAPDGALCVEPADRLTPEDEAAVARWRHTLEAIIDYVDTLPSASREIF
jgi:hypothetical protein